MKATRRILFGLVVASTTTACSSSAAEAYQPRWSPVVIATGEYRQQIQATPIEYRPNRPLHFYGNAVRRRHYTGSYLPTLGLRAVNRR